MKTVHCSSCNVSVIFSDFKQKKIEFLRQILEKCSYIKFHNNPSSGSRVCSMRTDGQTDTTKLIVAFRNFANAPKMSQRTSFVISCKSIPVWFFTDRKWKRYWIFFRLHSGSLVDFLSINSSNGFEIREKKINDSENKWAEKEIYFYRQMLTSLGLLDPWKWDRHVPKRR